MSKEEILENKLDDDELDKVAGGKMVYDAKDGTWGSDCYCAVGGGGTSDNYQKTCACVAAGAGEFTEAGKALNHNGIGSTGVAMFCTGIVGMGIGHG